MSQVQDEQIDSQQSTSNENEQTPESSTQGQSEQVDENNLIPEKFLGKSTLEIVQAYRELEKDRGRLANELGSTRKEQEESVRKWKELELAQARYNQAPQYQQPPVAQREPELDPLAVIDESFDEDPKEAVKKALKVFNDQTKRQSQEQSLNARYNEGVEFYLKQKQENPDYARREPRMQELMLKYKDIIKPEYLNSKSALEALDLMSRGSDLEYYTKQAVASAQKNGSSMRQEKMRAQSESSSSEGEQLRDFSKLSSTEMKKLLSNDE